MDDNFAEIVKGVMSDPEAMSKLMSVAQGLMGGGEKEAVEAPQPSSELKQTSSLTDALRSGNEERIALISALKPFLSDTRQKNADSLIKMLKMMRLADMNKLLNNL